MIGTILWALVVGVVLGYLGKLLLPGRQNIPAWATIGAGVVAALVGGVIADWLGVGETVASTGSSTASRSSWPSSRSGPSPGSSAGAAPPRRHARRLLTHTTPPIKGTWPWIGG